MSTTALRIIQLVKSLPPSEQRAVSAALVHLNPAVPVALAAAPFGPEDYVGLPDDDPFFKVMDEVERERHAWMGPPPPVLD